MGLFELLKVTITVPEKVAPKLYIGGNRITRLLFKSISLDVCLKDSEITGFFELETSLESPFNVIYLKKPNARARCPVGVPVLRGKEAFELSELSEDTQLVWLSYPDIEQPIVADEIRRTWRDKFQFREEDSENKLSGLRKPQLGALHAISAYFATDREVEPATVVLPTGTGKTETMLATLIYQQCEKLLVIVPSDSLRTQISKKYIELGYLIELGVLSKNVKMPAVAVLKKGIKTAENAERLTEASNVIVATAGVLSSSNSDAIDQLCNMCTHLFVDEAHHISAQSWLAVRNRFIGKKVVQFTATPFRNDKNALGGRIIYNYTMGEAQRAGYFTQVNLLPVEEFYSDRIDRAIAETAINQLREDLSNGLDHLLMARTNSKNKADSLWGLYQELATDLAPIVVYSSLGKNEIRTRLEGLFDRDSKVVICVDMLGEGYDLPNLKIAALHDYHKSLAVTLQFIGRFTRTSHSQRLGQATVVMNVADPNVEGDLQNLYSLGADWDTVLRRLSEGRIEREIRLQEVVDALKSKGDLHNQISLWNIEPSYTAMLFRTTCQNWFPDKFADNFPRFDEYWHAISEDENLLVVLAVQTTPVKWGSYKDLRDSNYKLLITHWDVDRQALFVFSNDYKVFRVEKMVESICENQCELLSGDQIFNVFNGIQYPLARNLGAAQIGAISFTQFFGPNVTEGLTLIEESQSSLSNIAALGYESGERVIWGCSQKKGKVWSPQKGGSISDWIDWVRKAWDKVDADQPDEHNITRNFLRPKRMNVPHSSYPISAQWGEQLIATFEHKIEFNFGDIPVPFYLVDLETAGKGTDGSVHIVFSCEDAFSEYKLVISSDISAKGYEYELVDGVELSIKKGNAEAIPLPEYMMSDPLTIHYADNSFSYNAHIVYVEENVGEFSTDDIVTIDWSDTNIRKESMGYEQDSSSIQWHFYNSIQEQYDVIVNDDGKGESADLVCLKVLEDAVLLTLVHCKYSSADEPGARLKDLYEVCGQAQRSIRWKHLNLNYLYYHIKRRQEQWRSRGYSRFLKGTIEDLAAIKNRTRTSPLDFHVVIVQPGLCIGQVTQESLRLLGCTALFIKKTTLDDLEVIGSE